MAFLYEYGQWQPVSDKNGLRQMLKSVWQQKLFVPADEEIAEEDIDNSYQPFLQFDGYKVRAKNYVGFIQNGTELIEIYPKVFRASGYEDKAIMLRHIFFWFKYCRKWRFPFSEASLDVEQIQEFPELIIYLIAKQFYETISCQPLMQYHMVEEAMHTPKGSINFSRYISNSLTRGNYHEVECDHEPFLFDNRVNRIIKYCVRLLKEQTRFSENLRLLDDTLFILDEVEDVPCTLGYAESVSLNSYYKDYDLVMGNCKMIISQQLYSSNTYDLSQWCLLFPMEYIFEDFIAGFLETYFSDTWLVKYQKSDEYLSNKPRAFNLQHDIFLTSKDGLKRNIIIDAKYKIRSADFKTDNKKGIAQSDLYQMVSYAYRRGCSEVILLYPNISEGLFEPDTFEINSEFDKDIGIKVTALEIPFWSTDNFASIESRLMELFTRILN